MNITFSYTNRRLYGHFFMGISWLVFALIAAFTCEKFCWQIYVYMCLGTCYLGMYCYEKLFKYVEIYSDTLVVNSLFDDKKIQISDITAVKYFAEDYTFITANMEVKINKYQIKKEEQAAFEDFYQSIAMGLSRQ